MNNPITTRDPLTGLLDRSGFLCYVENQLKANNGAQYTIIYGNIHNFKVINEIRGTQVGDKVLIDFAEKFSSCSHLEAARMESDHFILCIPLEDFDVDRLVGLSQNQYKDIRYTARFGIYRIRDLTMSVNAMCDRAKAAKRYITDEYYVPYAIWDETMREEIVSEGILSTELKPAIEAGEFVVYYQPIVDAKTQEIASAEALIRWNHPKYGFISPGKFIPVFEKNASIAKLDYFVGITVVNFIQSRLSVGKAIVPISVNASRMDFHNHQIAHLIISKVDCLGVPPELLRIEVTESIYALEPKQILTEIQQMRTYGIQVLLDDFGSGYSSFNTLTTLMWISLKSI
ncbi:diguanylate cyclase (GGDEF) domain-containing protein [Eubacterium aggregans]|uniref:Diguanylate cyclase (GGDEF) domain-containing protein n=1 Tax=Eubacterium aggregans TaxID=81409 RepID=A0A1H3ZEK5_9FIRM|nr:GGDEF domain-containing phosphodiesterase [Eubacterium aggregans]SEA21804.1 diguanylate cyclase (GGDEF) domain-containing protein [Eubacterium aggregans]